MQRRDWLKFGVGGIASAMLARTAGLGAQTGNGGKAKRVVFMFMAGGPSQLESFDYKPNLRDLRNTELPSSVQRGLPITTMTSGRGPLMVADALVSFAQHGQSGLWVSELFPHVAKIADDLTLIKSMTADQVNHGPACDLMITGSPVPGKPSLGSWLSYGLGTANSTLPSFVSMTSDSKVAFVQPLSKRLWSSAFLPVTHGGVGMRPGARPVLYLDDGLALPAAPRRELFDAVRALNDEHFKVVGDPDIAQRNYAYEVAANMQNSVAELADLSSEPEEVYDLYGPASRVSGTFAANCLRTRRLLERDVRCVLLMHRGWDAHYEQTKEMRACAGDVDQPTAALITDLKQRGLLEDTLILWGGEFGRTAYSQGEITLEDHGRDHHPYCFPMLLAGGGVKPGITYGETDDFSYNVTANPVGVHDLHATMLQILGLDQNALTFAHEGRNHRLTDLGGRVITDILS
jgi:hypothetical protein